ncbi:hypothetical protein Tco_0536694, partial [Tanacetum coccineum]
NQEDGEDSEIPIDSQHILITTQPSTSKPQKKQSRRKQKKNTEVPHTSDSTADVPNEEHVLTHSNDPLLSGEDRMKLTELMDMCTKFFKRVLDLEHNKTAEAQEIINLKLRVKKLDKKAGLRTHKFKRLYKVGVTRRVASSDDEVETQRRNDENNDNMMFDTGVFDGDEIVIETKEPVINAAMPTKSIPEKDVVQESSKNVSTATIMVSTATIAVVATPKSKDKGKAIMIEPEKQLKKKDQIELDEELAREIEAEEQAELERILKERVAQEEASKEAIYEE